MKELLYHIFNINRTLYPEFSFSWGDKIWVVVLVALFAILYLLFVKKDFSFLKNRGKILLLFSILIVLFMIFLSGQPEFTFYKIKIKPMEGVFLIDNSMSMSIKSKGGDREEWVKNFLLGKIDQLQAINNFFPLSFYSFDSKLHLLGKFPAGTLNTKKLQFVLEKLKKNGGKSSLKKALASLSSSKKIAWIVVLTDGVIDNRVEHNNSPIYVVYPPSFHGKDLSIVSVDAPALAYVRNPASTTLKIESTYDTIVKTPLRVFEDGKLILTRIIEVKPGMRNYDISFRPNFTGQHTYRFVLLFPGDSISVNNSYTIVLNILLDKIRVLQVVGRPTWDSRFLRLYLKHDPRIDLISFTILRSNSDNPMSGEDELSLIPFPTNMLFSTELDNFDVVILQNFNYRDYFVFNDMLLLENLKKFVTNRGGGLVLIGGDLSFSEGDYQNTPVAQIMPVQIPDGKGMFSVEPVKLELTESGAVHPITSLGLSPEKARSIWSEALPIDGENLVNGLQDGGIPLLVDKRNGNVVVSVRDVGRGRTLSIATDSLWEIAFRNWKYPEVRRTYFEFWRRSIRWLIRDQGFRSIKIETDPSIAYPGEKVEIKIHAFKTDFKPFKKSELTATLLEMDGKLHNLSLSGKNGTFASSFTPTAPGTYIIKVTGMSGSKKVEEAIARCIVLNPAAEEKRILHIKKDMIDGKELKNFSPELLVKKVIFSPENNMVVGKRIIPIWDNWLILLILALLLTLYWILRRRSGLV